MAGMFIGGTNIEQATARPKRGRPPGTKHWTDFAQVRMYARITHIIERDGCDARKAARVWLDEGHVYVNGNARRYWTYPSTDIARHQLSKVIARCEPGYARTEHGDSIESIRVQYQKAKARYRRDATFRADCDFWVRFEQLHEQMGDPIAAFEAACNE